MPCRIFAPRGARGQHENTTKWRPVERKYNKVQVCRIRGVKPKVTKIRQRYHIFLLLWFYWGPRGTKGESTKIKWTLCGVFCVFAWRSAKHKYDKEVVTLSYFRVFVRRPAKGKYDMAHTIHHISVALILCILIFHESISKWNLTTIILKLTCWF
jgi:hypothetical protein